MHVVRLSSTYVFTTSQTQTEREHELQLHQATNPALSCHPAQTITLTQPYLATQPEL